MRRSPLSRYSKSNTAIESAENLFPPGRSNLLLLPPEKRGRKQHLTVGNSADNLLGVVANVCARTVDRDVTPIRALRNSEVFLSRLLETTKILVWEAEPQTWRFSFVSPQAEKILGFPVARWYEPDFLALNLHPEDRHLIFPDCEHPTQSGEPFDLTFRLFAQDGRVVWFHTHISITSQDSALKRMFGFMIDISEQKHAEEELIELGGRLIVAQEKERSRIARELHDDFNQRLALLSIELEQLGQTVHEPVNHQLLQKLQRDAKELSADVHRLSYSLHPSKLDHLGLVAAVKSLCEEISESSKIKVEFKHDGLLATLPKDVTLCFFRITQESLRNSVKHSGAEAVRVLLVRTRNAVRLSVSDNGCGFDTKSEKMRAGLGFISMRERLHVVGGELHIYSRPRRGTRIEASVPLRPDFKQGNSLESVLVKT